MYENTIKMKVEEGRRVGKNPWCCSDYVEGVAYDILNAEGDYPQETMKESRTRWCEEGVITKEELEQDEIDDRKRKECNIMRRIKHALQELSAYTKINEYSPGFLEEPMPMERHHKEDILIALEIVKEKLYKRHNGFEIEEY